MAEEKQTQSAASSAAPDSAAKAPETAPTMADLEQTVADQQNQLADLTAALADAKKQAVAMEDQNLRAQAEIQNMTKRFKKEQSQLLKYDGQDLAKAILPVLDNLKRALAIEVDDDSGQQLKKGIQMVHDHLTTALTDHGITAVTGLGEPFDPTSQQAVQTVAATDDQQPDTVVQVLQAGYRLHDRVLRPAMVVVAQ